MRQLLTRWITAGREVAASLDWLVPLLKRIYFGYFWVENWLGQDP